MLYKALIVDDNISTAKLHQQVLKKLNIDANIVFSGQECLDEINNHYCDYDIVVTDNQMPNMSGIELLKKLRKIENFNLPVVIVTGDDNKNFIFTNYYGFDGYIQKPLDVLKVNDVIVGIIKNNSEC